MIKTTFWLVSVFLMGCGHVQTSSPVGSETQWSRLATLTGLWQFESEPLYVAIGPHGSSSNRMKVVVVDFSDHRLEDPETYEFTLFESATDGAYWASVPHDAKSPYTAYELLKLSLAGDTLVVKVLDPESAQRVAVQAGIKIRVVRESRWSLKDPSDNSILLAAESEELSKFVENFGSRIAVKEEGRLRRLVTSPAP